MLHPDKCSLPDAEAAFKRVKQAFEELMSRVGSSAGGNSSQHGPAVTEQTVPPSSSTAAPGFWPSRNQVGRKFTVRVAPAPRRNPASSVATATQSAPAPIHEDDENEDDDDNDGAGDADEGDDDEESSESESESDEQVGVSFADESTPQEEEVISSASEDEQEMKSAEPKAAKQKKAARLVSKAPAKGKRPRKEAGKKRGEKRKGEKKRRRKRRRVSATSDDEEDGGGAWRARGRPASASEQVGGRRSGRLANLARVDYRMLDGENDDEDGVLVDERGKAWVPPLWFEYQTDSDDGEEEVQRKKELKQRVLQAKVRAKQAKEEAAAPPNDDDDDGGEDSDDGDDDAASEPRPAPSRRVATAAGAVPRERSPATAKDDQSSNGSESSGLWDDEGEAEGIAIGGTEPQAQWEAVAGSTHPTGGGEHEDDEEEDLLGLIGD